VSKPALLAYNAHLAVYAAAVPSCPFYGATPSRANHGRHQDGRLLDRNAIRDRPEPGGATVGLVGEPGDRMKWRVVMEVTRTDGAVRVHEIGGGAAVDEYSPRTVGLTLAEGKLGLCQRSRH
jgi:hypothetical protein